MFVLIETIEFMVQVGHEQVHPAILIQVGGIYSHARTRLPSLAIGHASGESDFVRSQAMRSIRSCCFDNPANVIFVPEIAARGLVRNASSSSKPHVPPAPCMPVE